MKATARHPPLSHLAACAQGAPSPAVGHAPHAVCQWSGAVMAPRTVVMALTKLAALTWHVAGGWAASMAPSLPQTCLVQPEGPQTFTARGW